MKLNKILSGLKKIAPITHFKVLVITIVFLLLAIISPSHQIFFVLSFLYFLTLIFVTKSINTTVVFAFLPLLLLNVGRQFSFLIIPKDLVLNPLYWYGKSLTFDFSPFFVLEIVSIIVLTTEIVTHKIRFRLSVSVALLLLVFLLYFVSAILSHYLNELSYVYTLEEFSVLVWIIFCINEIINKPVYIKQRVVNTFVLILVSMTVLEGGITTLQFLKRAPLGLSVERVDSTPSFGNGADESSFQYRPVGLHYHANDLANWYIMLFFGTLILYACSNDQKKLRPAVITGIIISIFVLLLTLSRSAYLCLGIFCVMLILYIPSVIHRIIFWCSGQIKKYILWLIPIMVLISYLTADRLFTSVYTFSDYGGWTTRLQQIGDSLVIFSSAPLFGVGIGMFIPASFQLIPMGSIQY